MKPATFTAVFDALCSQYPATFSRDPLKIRPLKLGILEDIVAEHGEAMRRPIEAALRHYQHWPDYLYTVAYGRRRRDLQGKKAGHVTPEERQLAARGLERLELWTESHQKYFDHRAKLL